MVETPLYDSCVEGGDMAEYLLGWTAGLGAGKPDHAAYVVRPLTDAEDAAIRAASGLLNEVVGANAFADLIHAQDELEAAHGALVSAHRAGLGHNEARTLDRRYKAWLAAFRSWVDRTHHGLSKVYGKGSAEYEGGDGYFSEEFDANFGYRVACALRNVGEHQGSVLNAVKMRSRMVDGSSVMEVDARIDLRRLVAADTGGRLRPATRREMAAVDAPIDAGLLVELTMISCHRIQARIVIDRENDLRDAIDFVRGLHDEGVAAGGEQTVFMNEEAIRNPEGTNMVIRWNPSLWADAADRILAEAGGVLDQTPLSVTASDLA